MKFFGLCIVATVLLLASYQLFIRYTPIGWLLNGRRTPTYFRSSTPEVRGAGAG
jgi:hypothetical protein